MKRILVFMFLAVVLCVNASAQERIEGKDIKWKPIFERACMTKLVHYGTYQAGIPVTKIYPAKKKKKKEKDEQFFFGILEDNNVVVHVLPKGENVVYYAKLDKDMAYLANIEDDKDVKWLRLEYVETVSDDEMYLFIVDQDNTYRYLKTCSLEEAGIKL